MIPGTVGPIWLRNMVREDLNFMLKWRNNPQVYQGFYQQGKDSREISWPEHLRWWENRPTTWQGFIITLEYKPVGVLSVGQLDYWEPEIGIYVGETNLWGKGIAKQTLILALDWLRKEGYEYTRTTILDNNERSKRLFTSLGYKRIAEARPGESLYRKGLNE